MLRARVIDILRSRRADPKIDTLSLTSQLHLSLLVVLELARTQRLCSSSRIRTRAARARHQLQAYTYVYVRMRMQLPATYTRTCTGQDLGQLYRYICAASTGMAELVYCANVPL